MIEIERSQYGTTSRRFVAYCNTAPGLHRSAQRIARQIMRNCQSVRVTRFTALLIVSGWRGNEHHLAAYMPRKCGDA
jgi:hypothetical protein